MAAQARRRRGLGDGAGARRRQRGLSDGAGACGDGERRPRPAVGGRRASMGRKEQEKEKEVLGLGLRFKGVGWFAHI